MGRVPYGEMLQEQRDIFQDRVEFKKSGIHSGEDYLFFLEHTPVITLGKHAHKTNILLSKEDLRERGYDVFEVERGGDVTYHGPGQLVVYPILDLERYKLGVKSYVSFLEEVVIRTIAEYGIIGERVEGASGVWIGKGTDNERKICAVGVKISRYISMHGISLNVTTPLEAFRVINPCGFTDKGVTSIEAETGLKPSLFEVTRKMQRNFLELLGTEIAGPYCSLARYPQS